jgi:hypothetical protein
LLYPGETASDTHWINGCVGPVDGLDFVEKRKYLAFTAAFGNGKKLLPAALVIQNQCIHQ